MPRVRGDPVRVRASVQTPRAAQSRVVVAGSAFQRAPDHPSSRQAVRAPSRVGSFDESCRSL